MPEILHLRVRRVCETPTHLSYLQPPGALELCREALPAVSAATLKIIRLLHDLAIVLRLERFKVLPERSYPTIHPVIVPTSEDLDSLRPPSLSPFPNIVQLRRGPANDS
jgi:hypothetical protein